MSVPNLITVVLTVDREEMRWRGRAGARRLHQLHDARRTTAAARAAFMASFERAADPHSQLPDEERRWRAEALRREHFRRLGTLSAQARAARRVDRFTEAETSAPGRSNVRGEG